MASVSPAIESTASSSGSSAPFRRESTAASAWGSTSLGKSWRRTADPSKWRAGSGKAPRSRSSSPANRAPRRGRNRLAGGGPRKDHRKSRPLLSRRAHRYRSGMGRDDLGHDVEPQTEASLSAIRSLCPAPEGFEDGGQKLRRDRFAVVAHRDGDMGLG